MPATPHSDDSRTKTPADQLLSVCLFIVGLLPEEASWWETWTAILLVCMTIHWGRQSGNQPIHRASGARRRGLQAAPEEVREPPEHTGGYRPAPSLRTIAHPEVGDEGRPMQG